MHLIFPPHLTSASALPRETGNLEIASFTEILHVFFTKKYMKHIKISPSYSWSNRHCQNNPPGTPDRPSKHRILTSITQMLYVNQACHGVDRCVKDGSCSSSSLEWKSMDILLSQQNNVRRYYITDDIFSFRKIALCVQHSPTAAALLTNTAFEWKMWFSCFAIFRGSAEAQVIWGGIVKRPLIAYFIGNISAKKCQNPFVCQSYSKPKVGRFLRHSV